MHVSAEHIMEYMVLGILNTYHKTFQINTVIMKMLSIKIFIFNPSNL